MNYGPRSGVLGGGFENRLTPTTRFMLYLYGGVWLATVVLTKWIPVRVPMQQGPAGYEITNDFDLWQVLALNLPGSEGMGAGPGFRVWQLFTSHFLHDPSSVWNILMLLLMVFFFAGQVESFLGRRRFLSVWVAAAVGAAIGGVLMSYIQPGRALQAGIAPGITVLIVVFCAMMPEAVIHLFFVLPVKAKWLGMGTAAVVVLLALAQPEVSGGGDVGGLAAGYAWFRYGDDLNPRTWLLRLKLRRLRGGKGRFTVIDGGAGDEDPPVFH